MKCLQRRFFSYTLSWNYLRKIGINLDKYRAPYHPVIREGMIHLDKNIIIPILQNKMPEMLRLLGYDIDKTPQLSLDYFSAYLYSVFNTYDHYPKPSGRYLFSGEGYRVLVDENNEPVKLGTPKRWGISQFDGKKFVAETYRL